MGLTGPCQSCRLGRWFVAPVLLVPLPERDMLCDRCKAGLRVAEDGDRFDRAVESCAESRSRAQIVRLLRGVTG